MLDEIIRNKRLEEIKEWYSHDFVIFEIIKCLQHRETSFLSDKTERELGKNVRLCPINAKDFLVKHFEWVGIYRNLINIYNSVAVLEPIPKMSFNPIKRTQEPQYKDYQKNYNNHIINYDFYIDFDGKNENFYNQAKEFKKILDEYKLPYYVLNSSSKGFHFIIEGKWLPEKPISDLIKEIYSIMFNIKGIYEFDCLDISIYDNKRIRKCPYSYVCSDGTVALPLTDEQFDNFNIEMVLMKNVLKNIKLFKRELLIRNLNLPEEQLKQNILRFWNDYLE